MQSLTNNQSSNGFFIKSSYRISNSLEIYDLFASTANASLKERPWMQRNDY